MKRIFIKTVDTDKIQCVTMNFSDSYSVKNEELASTCALMVSPDYKERFKAEYMQLKNRIESLRAMLVKWDNDKLDFTPTCPRKMLGSQLIAMEDYLTILKERAVLEKIELI